MRPAVLPGLTVLRQRHRGNGADDGTKDGVSAALARRTLGWKPFAAPEQHTEVDVRFRQPFHEVQARVPAAGFKAREAHYDSLRHNPSKRSAAGLLSHPSVPGILVPKPIDIARAIE